MKTIGLIGGMSWESTVEYYRQINETMKERNVLAAGALDGARPNDAPRVGEEDNFEQHGRWVGRGTVQVVAVASIERRQVDLPINQPTQSVLEGARKKLPFQIHGQNARARVDVFVARQTLLRKSNNYSSLDIPYGSRQDARMERLFLHLR